MGRDDVCTRRSIRELARLNRMYRLGNEPVDFGCRLNFGLGIQLDQPFVHWGDTDGAR